MAFISKFRNLIISVALLAFAGYYLHKPLPENLTQRRKLHIIEPLMRLVYFYPQQALGYLGVTWQVMWTRNTFNFCGYLINLATAHEAGVKETYDTTFDGVPVRVYIPEKRKNNGSIVLIHGGGFVLMNVESYDSFSRQFVINSGMVVVSIE